MKRRLYLHLYLALLVSTFVCLGVAAIAFRMLRDSGGPPRERMRRAALTLADRLPDVRSPDVATRVAEIGQELDVDIVVGDDSGPLAGFPSVRAVPVAARPSPGWRRDRMGAFLVTALDGGGWAALRATGPYRRLRVHPFFATLVILALVMAVGSYPVARRVTRRLEVVARAVERWGHGDLAARVPVSRNDEVAMLATTFNQAAERVDLLLVQQKQMLANASHELRSPLARLRMGLELIGEEADGARRQTMVQEIHRDIVELDSLIEDVLIMARSDARVPRRVLVPVDLRAVVDEEARRTGAAVEGAAAVSLAGDAVLLRHMVRNLLENAQQYGAGTDVCARLSTEGALVRLAVEDQGPGVPEGDRERIFAPFFRLAVPSGASPVPGHGLGLALVRQVARYHGGDVVYRPREPRGSCFEITLPINA